MKNMTRNIVTTTAAAIIISLSACDSATDQTANSESTTDSTLAVATVDTVSSTVSTQENTESKQDCCDEGHDKLASMPEGCTMDKTKMASMPEGCTMDKTKMAAMTEEQTKVDVKTAAKPAGCGMEECDMGDGTSGCEMTDPNEIANCDKAACPKVVGIMEEALKSWNHYGTAETMNRTPIGVDFLDKQKEASVTVVADISNVCEKKGCWMEITDENGKNPVRVTFKDYAFFIPRNAKGHQTVVSGQSKLITRDVEYLRHIAEDQGKSPEEIAKITEPVKQLEIIADKVYIQGEELEEPNKP